MDCISFTSISYTDMQGGPLIRKWMYVGLNFMESICYVTACAGDKMVARLMAAERCL